MDERKNIFLPVIFYTLLIAVYVLFFKGVHHMVKESGLITSGKREAKVEVQLDFGFLENFDKEQKQVLLEAFTKSEEWSVGKPLWPGAGEDAFQVVRREKTSLGWITPHRVLHSGRENPPELDVFIYFFNTENGRLPWTGLGNEDQVQTSADMRKIDIPVIRKNWGDDRLHSDLRIKANRILLSFREKSNDTERLLTKNAVSDVSMRLRNHLSGNSQNDMSATDIPQIPTCELLLGKKFYDPGYLTGYVNPGESGIIYGKFFGKKSDKEVEHSQTAYEQIGWSEDNNELYYFSILIRSLHNKKDSNVLKLLFKSKSGGNVRVLIPQCQ